MAGIIEPEEIEKYKSQWGNRYEEISLWDLLCIMSGKVLYLNDGEYSTFVWLKHPSEGEKNERP